MRRIIYTIGDGLLVIALFTAALSAQNATKASPAKLVVVAPPLPHGITELLGHPRWLNLKNGMDPG